MERGIGTIAEHHLQGGTKIGFHSGIDRKVVLSALGSLFWPSMQAIQPGLARSPGPRILPVNYNCTNSLDFPISGGFRATDVKND
jgi:hypothetical protein